MRTPATHTESESNMIVYRAYFLTLSNKTMDHRAFRQFNPLKMYAMKNHRRKMRRRGKRRRCNKIGAAFRRRKCSEMLLLLMLLVFGLSFLTANANVPSNSFSLHRPNIFTIARNTNMLCCLCTNERSAASACHGPKERKAEYAKEKIENKGRSRNT